MQKESLVTTEHWCLLTWAGWGWWVGKGESWMKEKYKIVFCFGEILENKD